MYCYNCKSSQPEGSRTCADCGGALDATAHALSTRQVKWALLVILLVTVAALLRGESSDVTAPTTPRKTEPVSRSRNFTPADREFMKENGLNEIDIQAAEKTICKGGGEC